MIHKLKHFAIYVDDLNRAKAFYSNLFNWDFNEYGPGDFLQIKDQTGEKAELIGALQSRKYCPLKEKVIGFECSIEVNDIEKTIEKVNSNGGKILLPKTAIPFVGWLTKFTDTEGNIVCAIAYDSTAK